MTDLKLPEDSHWCNADCEDGYNVDHDERFPCPECDGKGYNRCELDGDCEQHGWTRGPRSPQLTG